jgi:Sec-independent protein secretion pathway components
MNLLEILLLVVIGLVLFKPGTLPQMGGGIGKAIANFKRSLNEPEEIDATDTMKNDTMKKDKTDPPPKV